MTQFNESATFQKLEAACRITGLSTYSLRKGCKDGSIPCVKRAGKYLVNVPALLRQLEEESVRGKQASA